MDLLLRLVPDTGGALRQAMTLCLMSYQDPRTTQFMLDAFGASRDAPIVLRLGQRLLLERGIEFFRPYLWGSGSAQALAAAQICGEEPGLSTEERLRIGLLLPDNPPVPPIDQDSLSAWLSELAGPFASLARRRAEELDAMLLWPSWERLGTTNQSWLLELTARCNPERARTEVERLLDRGCLLPFVVELAHRLGSPLPAALLDHEDPSLRALAISSGLADSDLARFLHGTVEEALAAARRCTPAMWVDLLCDARWQVRSLAVHLLAASEHRPLESVKALVGSSSKGQRVAAVELLRCWGEDVWLEERLL